MKALSVLTMAAALCSFLPPSATAQGLSLVVLGAGQITSSSAQEVSRQVKLLPTVDNGVTMGIWKKNAAGYVCTKVVKEEGYVTCDANLLVQVRYEVNGYARVLQFKTDWQRRSYQGDDLLSNEEYQELQATDYSDRMRAILSEIYDVQSGAIFVERPHRFKKELRLLVDPATKQIKSYEVVKKNVGWQRPNQ